MQRRRYALLCCAAPCIVLADKVASTPLQLETRFGGTILLGFSIGRGLGALTGLSARRVSHRRRWHPFFSVSYFTRYHFATARCTVVMVLSLPLSWLTFFLPALTHALLPFSPPLLFFVRFPVCLLPFTVRDNVGDDAGDMAVITMTMVVVVVVMWIIGMMITD